VRRTLTGTNHNDVCILWLVHGRGQLSRCMKWLWYEAVLILYVLILR
jgi:hypothetical protein